MTINDETKALSSSDSLKEIIPTKLYFEDFEINTSDVKVLKESFSISPALLQSMIDLAKKNNLQLNTLFHGAWGILLNRFSSSEDIYYHTENKIVHLHISKDVSIISYLKELNIKLNDSEATEKKSDEIKYFFNLKNQSQPDINQFTLSFIVEHNGSCVVNAFYHTGKFSTQNIQKLLEHYLVILQKIISDPEQLLTYFSILTSEEKNKILNEWKGISKYSEFFQQNYAVHDLFSARASQSPDAIAIQYGQTQLTYKALDEISNRLCHELQRRGICGSENIVVMMERTPAIIVAMLAIFKVGAVYIPMSPKYPDERIKFIINDANPSVILANSLENISSELRNKTILLDDQYLALKTSHTHQVIPNKVSAEHIAYIIYTSGTTGQPKGVMIKHSSLVNLALWYQDIFSVKASDRFSQFASQGFDAFFCETIPALVSGASIYMIDDNSKLTPSLLLPWLAEQKITISDFPTAYMEVLFNLTWPKNLKLRLVKIGGESLTRYPSQLFSFDIWNCYGPTEATVEATYIKIYAANIPPNAQTLQHLPPPIGKPLANAEVYVVDKYLQPVPIGVPGELLIGGMGVSLGYLNRAQLSREKFINDPFNNIPNAKLYKTGDLVRWLHDGNLEFIGRIDNQVKIRGFRIELNEVQTTINQFPDVNEAIVLTKDNNGNKTLVAYLVPKIEKIRIPFQEPCLIAMNESKYAEYLSDDISKEGMAISGVTDQFAEGQAIKIKIKLPGMNDSRWFNGNVIWQKDSRMGIKFDSDAKQTELLSKCIEYYLSTHNLVETLQGIAIKRNFKKALKKKLPEFMVPSVFTILPEFPLTFNGKIDWRALPPPKDFERLIERKHVPPRNETETKISKLWEELLDLPSVSITDNFFDLGGNSLLVSQLSIKILQEFNIALPTKILFDLPFIPIIAEYILSNGKEYTYQSSIQDTICHDAILNDTLLPNNNISLENLKNPQNILLTGAGGFLGISLLHSLLQKTEATIYCLIRKGELESAAKKLMQTIQHFGLSNDISLANRRIIVIDSDIGFDKFGVSNNLYEGLAQKIDVIYHCGAQVNTMASYTNLRSSNVQGTLEIIKFAITKKDKAIHYISTLSSAYKKDEQGNFVEEFPDAIAASLVGGYAISKWVSERLLTQLKNRGLPVSIYRSGYILGRRDSGVTNTNDALLLLIKGCIQMGFAPNWHEKITLLPVDFVSQAIVGISLHQSEKSKVYHIDHPKGILWTDLISWLNHYGFAIKLCPHQEWLQHLMKIDKTNALFHFLPHYLSAESEPKTPETNISNAANVLQSIHITFPEINDTLLSTYVNYLQKIKFLPESIKQPKHPAISNLNGE